MAILINLDIFHFLQKSTIADYLDVQLRLIGADSATKFMAYYLSELLLPHMEFGRCARKPDFNLSSLGENIAGYIHYAQLLVL